ncbi:MAG: glutamate-1-semialdehyde-2,1-aminomutase [Candidatus Eremiobacter antarcticus]|nr:glutamate-1-semialdehyde 2,1-aminomutase [Candidatus Eremiobacteraeota bacterium]MBC5807997.1 glutamate-1-semialdehyde 2,1-aminomutase [Candidatus Eremiobacteraeota bacterium]PZR62643.1 MAG: glutamate-1-semialdehyde-2,1-aminomutase [Candidatus Eremiobacter sp. RRmetagenome_bin22]
MSRSDVLFAAAQRRLPGGVNSPVRAFRAVGGVPRVIVRGEGSRIYDADGKEYIDYVSSWGALVCGHAHPHIVNAVARAAEAGTSFGACTPAEEELAAIIMGAMPSIELMRFVSSGTEACMSAVRLARGYTGRELVVKCDGCYHGHSDALLASAGSGALTLGVPGSAGVTAAAAAQTLVIPYNDVDALANAFERHGSRIACIIVEPVAANMGVVPPGEGYLRRVCEIARSHAALVIFDEVITGFRVAWGGAQTLYGLRPDLTCLGKAIGAGMPVGAFGGRKDVMSKLAPLGDVYQAGTLSGNPVAMAAGIAQLQLLGAPGAYDRLEESGALLEAGMRAAVKRSDAALALTRVGSMWTLFFSAERPRDLATVKRSDTKSFAAYFHAMLEGGVYLAPSQFEAGFVTLAHSRSDIEESVKVAESSLQTLAEKTSA